MKIPSTWRPPSRDWPEDVPDAPEDLVDLVADAMVDFGPDGHHDGCKVIAALALDWAKQNPQ